MHSSYDWVREIKPDLKKLDSIPLTGNTPSFPWDEFATRLARSFDREGLSIQPGEMTWRAKENLYEGLGDAPFPLNFSIPSLRGQVSWVMPKQEISLLATLLLTKESHSLPFDQTLSESFYHFLAAEVLYHFTQVSFDKQLVPILTSQSTLPNEDALCWDISIHLCEQTIWGRLIISPEFRHAWVEYFAQRQENSALSQRMAQLAPVIVHLEAGKTYLTLAEWMSVQLGDFIVLDQCSLDSEQLEGRILLTIHGKQAFRAKLKNGTLKILELPLLHEVETPMTKQPDEDDLNDLDLPEEDHEDLENEDLFSHAEDDLFAELEAGKNQSFKEPALSMTPKETQQPSPAKQALTPEQIPITLVVEVGQIQLTMEQLLKLEPGNLLEINSYPENRVDLTVNGRVVGKGELVRIGEVMGVRVLQLGR